MKRFGPPHPPTPKRGCGGSRHRRLQRLLIKRSRLILLHRRVTWRSHAPGEHLGTFAAPLHVIRARSLPSPTRGSVIKLMRSGGHFVAEKILIYRIDVHFVMMVWVLFCFVQTGCLFALSSPFFCQTFGLKLRCWCEKLLWRVGVLSQL